MLLSMPLVGNHTFLKDCAHFLEGLCPKRAPVPPIFQTRSSGVEHYIDTVGCTRKTPPTHTTEQPFQERLFFISP